MFICKEDKCRKEIDIVFRDVFYKFIVILLYNKGL